MTQDAIIEMAREAGICSWLKPPKDVKELLVAFANLVAAKEREACAKVCDEFNFGQAAMMIQRAIRARGKQA